MVALKQGSVPDVIANKLDHLLILTSGTEQYLITCTNKKYKFLLTTTLTISDYGKYLYTAFLVFTLIACNVQPVMAATIWDKASEIMKDVYNQIILISTIAAVVTASVALLLMNFSKSGKTVDESRAWLKRIIITWAILNGLGFIMAYITPFFAGGQWNG